MRRLALAVLLGASLLNAAHAAPLTPELQKLVRAATFEVVIKKPEKETATYEKPLPLELIPFVERNDHYWSIGTAFAIGPNTFVTAAHVVGAALSMQFGSPGIRAAADDKVYSIDKILKYDLREDFVVFSVQGAPPVSQPTRPLPSTIRSLPSAMRSARGSWCAMASSLP